MNKILNLLNSQAKFQKTKNILTLNNFGYNLPHMAIWKNDHDSEEAIKWLRLNVDNDYFHCRLIFSDLKYPHHISQFSERKSIEIVVKSLLKTAKELNINSYEIILQPFLNVEWSGAVLSKNNFNLIEICYGNPSILLRKGKLKQRLLISKDDNVFLKESFFQDTYLNLNSNGVLEYIAIDFDFYLEFNKYLSIFKNLEHNSIIEFGVKYNELYLFDLKHVPESTYKLTQLFNDQPVFNIFNEWKEDLTTIKLNAPEFEWVNKITNMDELKISNGAYLSHLGSYCAENRINCLFYRNQPNE